MPTQNSLYTEDYELEKREFTKIDKKYLKKGIPVYMLHRRTANTAVSVITYLKDVEFESLTLTMYLYCKDKSFEEFSHKYESQVELAKVAPEKFADGLYSFFDSISKYIQENNYYGRFFDFLAYCQERANDFVRNASDSMAMFSNSAVLNAYVNLLMETLEFLRKDKFNYNQIVVGLDSNGVPLCIPDKMPSLDLPEYEMVWQMKKNRSFDFTTLLRQTYAKYGYPNILSIESADYYKSQYSLYSNSINLMLPYINEHTLDILPQKMFKPMVSFWKYPEYIGNTSLDQFTDMLAHRKRTLPANGLLLTFAHSPYETILLREVYYADSIVLLARFCTVDGDVVLRYNTKKRTFFDSLSNVMVGDSDTNQIKASDDPLFASSLEKKYVLVMLWAYAAFVCNDSSILPSSQSFLEYFDAPDTTVEFLSLGNAAGSSGQSPQHAGAARAFQANYTTAEKAINGYIRKLPPGHKASERAAALAEQLGFDLDVDETYVQPFVRQTWILKQKPDTE